MVPIPTWTRTTSTGSRRTRRTRTTTTRSSRRKRTTRTFCFYFILYLLVTTWIRIRIQEASDYADPSGSGSEKLLFNKTQYWIYNFFYFCTCSCRTTLPEPFLLEIKMQHRLNCPEFSAWLVTCQCLAGALGPLPYSTCQCLAGALGPLPYLSMSGGSTRAAALPVKV